MNQPTISYKNKHQIGWNALYDVCKEQILDEGIVLISVGVNHYTAFQVGKPFNIFSMSDIKVLPGSALKVDTAGETEVVSPDVLTSNVCRFPTEEELMFYEEHVSV